MPIDELPLDELRRRFCAPDASPDVPARVVAALQADTRAGARAIGSVLERRRAAQRKERTRLRRLFALERELEREGLQTVAGVDEVGMGPLAGPVVAAAVILPRRVGIELRGLRDSKEVTPIARARLASQIREVARSVSIGTASREEIDTRNIYQAGLLAMRRAVNGLDPGPDHVLVDARTIPRLTVVQRAVVGGDRTVGTIAAASIVAKEYRDALMLRLDRRYPGYGFAQNRGYGTREHLDALARLGPSPAHRRSFAPVRGAE